MSAVASQPGLMHDGMRGEDVLYFLRRGTIHVINVTQGLEARMAVVSNFFDPYHAKLAVATLPDTRQS